MGKLYRCTCGSSYNLEEGKKYKCKNCGAIMSLSAAPAAVSSTSKSEPSNGSPDRPTTRTGSSLSGKRPSQMGKTSAARTRPGSSRLSSRTRGEEGEEEVKQGLPKGAKIGIAAFIAVSVITIIILANSGGPATPEAPKKDPAVVAAEQKKKSDEIAAAAAAAKAAEAAKRVPKKLSKEEIETVKASMKSSEAAKDPNILYQVLAKAKEENWELDANFKEDIYRTLLRLNPLDPKVTELLGRFERNKLNYDNWKARWVVAEVNKDVKALKAEIDWIFKYDMYTPELDGLDYRLVYKAINRVDPQDHEARVALGLEPYDGPIQEYKGQKLTADKYQDARAREWLAKTGKQQP